MSRKAERTAECEDEIADAAAIDVMANYVETCIGFKKSIENMDRFARRRSDDLYVERSIAARDRRVELDDRVGSVMAVDTAGNFAAIAKMDMLSIGGGDGVRTEDGREGGGMLGLDELGERQGESLLPEVPDRHLL